MANQMASNLVKQTVATMATRWAVRKEPHLVILKETMTESWSALQKAKSLDWKMAYC
jgi:hypothetical protein